MRHERRLRQATRYLRQRGITEDPETVAVTVRLRSAQARGGVILGAIGLAIYLPWLFAAGPFTSMAYGSVVPFAGTIVAGALLPSIGGALALGRTAPGPGPHVAHATRPGVRDYLPPVQRWWSPALVAASGLLTLAYVVVPPHDPMTGRAEAVGAWALAASLVGANELVAQWLVRRPQPAASPGELVVRNELTGDTLGVLSAYALPALVIMALGVEYTMFALQIGFALALVPGALEGARRRRVRDHIWRVPAG